MATNGTRTDSLRGYLRYSLSFREAEELLRERRLAAHHATIAVASDRKTA